jgi:DNA-directed RNA polymerase subunit RPC12/RpoP
MRSKKTMTVEVYHDSDIIIVAIDKPCCSWADNAIAPQYYRRRGKLVYYRKVNENTYRPTVPAWFWGGNSVCWGPTFDETYPPTVSCKVDMPFNFCPSCGAKIIVKQIPYEEARLVKEEREREKRIEQVEEILMA